MSGGSPPGAVATGRTEAPVSVIIPGLPNAGPSPRQAARFRVDAGVKAVPASDPSRINWRESLRSRVCRLTKRNSGALHAILDTLAGKTATRVYLSEQLTPLFRAVRRVLPDAAGSVSVPFLDQTATTQLRARPRADGSIEHLAPPEYHGDPVSADGVLCFQYFGWDLLDTLHALTPCDAMVHFHWSRELGYLGPAQSLIVVRKHPRD